ncbi:MAG: 2OG-Fe(II) oxygenase [Bacteroidota bacterium]|nr:2OG-Fe(II) oxygenase [Bacteroidota bacterium]
MNNSFDDIIQGLMKDGYYVNDHFLSDEMTAQLRENAIELHNHGQFKNAAIGKKNSEMIIENVRNDQIHWLSDSSNNPFETAFLNIINELIIYLNRQAYLGIRSKELHYAIYTPGAFYNKHLDAFQKENKRIVSIVCYLNKHWGAFMGGQLRMYLPENQIDIEPLGGRMVCFLSEEIPHEVLPATQNRYSVTGWLKTA